MAVNLNNQPVTTGSADRQLRGAFGTLGLFHDLLAELVIPGLLSQTGQRRGHMLRLHLLARSGGAGGRHPGSGKTERLGSSSSSRGSGAAA